MSGNSYDQECPRCGSPNMQCYSDHKPHSISQGTCYVCGYQFYTDMSVMSPEELKGAREEYTADYDEDATFPDVVTLDKEKIKTFDEWIHPQIHEDKRCISCQKMKCESEMNQDKELCNLCYKEAMDSIEPANPCPECGYAMIDHGTGETCEGCGHMDTH